LSQRVVGVALESLGLPFRDALRTAAATGFSAIQFEAVGDLAPQELSQTGRREIRHLLKQHSIKLAALSYPTRHGYDHLDRLEARIEGTGRALALAHDLGAPIVINHAGKIPASDDAPRRLAFLEAMRRLANEADRVGSTLALLASSDPPDALEALIREVGGFGLAINFAPAHLLAVGVDLSAAARTLAPWMRHVHARDVVRSALAASGLREAPLGTGEVGWARLLQTLEAVDYQHPITVVAEPGTLSTKSARDALQLLRS
jgi:sugar phosphate isomerase/epimerase